ncbi:acylphosphatase [Solimonas variicoloris]|uniref:acylphosphatase n=1 Tax=Solimonas variicoloris TaxID=254408 RepID=UPI0003640786|nr:acylphosphatase [Solimonas variicoloris]
MSTSYRFRVRGRVQGVFFRQSTRERADALGLSGWVENRPDGSVEGLACGAAPALDALREWLQHGPPRARVDALDWERSDEPAAAGFSVRR